MEINNQQVQTELLALSNKANVLFKYFLTEESNLRDLLEKVYYYFGDQDEGKVLINELTQAIREIQCAYCEFEQLKGAIIEFAGVLTSN